MSRRIRKAHPESEDAEEAESNMVVNLDTEQLQDMMNILQEANNDIDIAADKLLSITTHNGWACKERYTINDYILENRNLIKALRSDCSSFCAAAKSVADDFVETERGISQMFSSVESALAQILANPVAFVVINSSAVGAIASNVISRNSGGTDGGLKVPEGGAGSILSQWARSVTTGIDASQLGSAASIINLDNFDLSGN